VTLSLIALIETFLLHFVMFYQLIGAHIIVELFVLNIFDYLVNRLRQSFVNLHRTIIISERYICDVLDKVDSRFPCRQFAPFLWTDCSTGVGRLAGCASTIYAAEFQQV
jgi:purine-cytosine permease-like protein